MLRVHYKKKQHGITLRSGHAYKFRYSAWANDPEPTAIFMYAFSGTHPNTNRQWRFYQMINLTYIPRAQRAAFAKDWVNVLRRTNGDTRFTWQLVQGKYPFLKLAVRRYFYSPNYYISKLQEIPYDDKFEKNVVSTFSKDFSKKVKVSLMSKFRNVFMRRKEFRKKGKFPKRTVR